MYVRWKPQQRQLQKAWREGRRSQTAVLVTTERVAGQPRQRIVAYLGHFAEHWRPNAGYRARFWARVEQRLAPLALDTPTRAAVDAKLAAVVPRPTAAELAEWEKGRAAWWAALRAPASGRRGRSA